MTYFVIVNQKYLVVVDSTSALSAEHKILDEVYYGVNTCQAFDFDSLSTDTFKGMSQGCKSASFEDLMKLGEKYRGIEQELTDELDKVASTENKIKELEAELSQAKESLRIEKQNVSILKYNLKSIW